uniref:poly(ADP-ribose) glycohydrolase n=1 Tax=Plectus sambesii TaxID=2011161 RepID=A0A914V8Z0_9BILA
MSTEAKEDDILDIDSSKEEIVVADDDDDDEDDNEDEKPKRAKKRPLRQSTIDETLFGRAACPVAKKPTKSLSITVKKTVVSKEDMNRLVAEKRSQGYGPVVAEATSCSNDEVRKMHQTLVAVNANRQSASVSSDKDAVEEVEVVAIEATAKEQLSHAGGSGKRAKDDESDSPDSIDMEMGADAASLLRTPQCSAQLPDLKAAEGHVVLVLVSSIDKAAPPQTFPSTTVDTTYGWLTGRNVRMPCSSENKYPSSNGTEIVDRWPMIQAALVGADSWQSSQDIEKAIISFNLRYKKSWSFDLLHRFFNNHLEKSLAERYMKTVVPAIARLALRLPELITQPLPLLRQGKSASITMSQEQAACLLANAFFCTFPSRNSSASILPSINFNTLYHGRRSNRSLQKLRCILHYFDRVLHSMPQGLLTFYRRCRDVFPDWAGSQKLLPRLHIDAGGMIEEGGIGMLQVDFANKYIGGGVLGHGCVQEEIRFLICPELIVGCLLTEELKENECLIMKGAEQYSEYSGYADSFQWTSDHVDDVPRDAWKRRETEIVGIDAVPFNRFAIQFTAHSILRELNKAFVGFYGDGQPPEHLSAIATGNWGCGAFGGDKELKSGPLFFFVKNSS